MTKYNRVGNEKREALKNSSGPTARMYLKSKSIDGHKVKKTAKK
jgi:hypothetical protein